VSYLPAIAPLQERARSRKKDETTGEKKMNHLLRPYRSFKYSVIPVLLFTSVLAVVIAVPPPKARAQSGGIITIVEGSSPLLLTGSQGYLGVEIVDVDSEKAQALKLKEVRGAVITLIDHDAPAGQIGLKVNDVVLQLNGQNVDGSEQLRRMLKEIPAGRKVSIEISRDGNIQTLAVELADRQVLGHDVWDKIDSGGDVFVQPPSMGILSGGGDVPPTAGGFHLPFFGSSLNVGALVEPLTSQMADYMGVPSGLMVKQVARKSEAAVAGLRAFDIILKVGTEPVTNLAGWDRALRSNQGKPVQLTILRDKKQQTLTLQVDSKHRQGSLQLQEVFPAEYCPLMAESIQEFKIDPEQMQQFQQQMEEFRKSFNSGDFKLDQKQQDELRHQMEQWKQQFQDMKLLRFGNYV
jgi:membrane-associated protease RseP (regulator of RpoE activity)